MPDAELRTLCHVGSPLRASPFFTASALRASALLSIAFSANVLHDYIDDTQNFASALRASTFGPAGLSMNTVPRRLGPSGLDLWPCVPQYQHCATSARPFVPRISVSPRQARSAEAKAKGDYSSDRHAPYLNRQFGPHRL